MANSAARVALPLSPGAPKARVNFSAVPAVPAPTEGSDPRASLQGLELSPRSTLPGAWSFAQVMDQTLEAGSLGLQAPSLPVSAIPAPLSSPLAVEQLAPIADLETRAVTGLSVFPAHREDEGVSFVPIPRFVAAKVAVLSEPLGAVPSMASQSGEFAYRLGHRLLELIAMEDAFAGSAGHGDGGAFAKSASQEVADRTRSRSAGGTASPRAAGILGREEGLMGGPSELERPDRLAGNDSTPFGGGQGNGTPGENVREGARPSTLVGEGSGPISARAAPAPVALIAMSVTQARLILSEIPAKASAGASNPRLSADAGKPVGGTRVRSFGLGASIGRTGLSAPPAKAEASPGLEAVSFSRSRALKISNEPSFMRRGAFPSYLGSLFFLVGLAMVTAPFLSSRHKARLHLDF